jgi:hypothetical protein
MEVFCKTEIWELGLLLSVLSDSLMFFVVYSGVAVGSSVGHAIGGFFGGGSSEPAPQQVQSQAPAQQDQYGNNNCAGATQAFTKCMDDHQGNMQVCNWYLEQLKACQAAASPY